MGPGHDQVTAYHHHRGHEIPFFSDDLPYLGDDTSDHCSYSLSINLMKEFGQAYYTKMPLAITIVVGVAFFLMLATFATYDWFVVHRNKKLVGAAVRSEAIVSSIFPSNVRERIFANDGEAPTSANQSGRTKGRLTGALVDEGGTGEIHKTKPIADLFLSTTIMFADIAGFTAWSSTREPSQVRRATPQHT
jgi:hypothetical protein